MALLEILIGSIVRAAPFVYKWSGAYRKYQGLAGYYVVCRQNGKPFINSPERVPNFVKIEVPKSEPNILNVFSKDFDISKLNAWKTWVNKIKMEGDNGEGYYNYLETIEPGMHNIFLVEGETDSIRVRVTDLGKASKSGSDNVPSIQLWKRLPEHDPMIEKFKQYKFTKFGF